MGIYTRLGDAGDTSLGDGSRVSKDSARVEAYGTIDEVNSLLGFARAANSDAALDELLGFAQHKLFNCSSCLSMPRAGSIDIGPDDVITLEGHIDRLSAALPELHGFIIENGSELATRLHVARSVTRRAERRIVALAATETIEPAVLAFVNRLSDALFTAARYANLLAGLDEELWDPHRL